MTRNVLLVVVDALRYDRVTDVTLTPNIQALGDRGERFTACFACADKTSTSLPTIQTGRYPTRHGLLHHGPAVTDEELRQFSSSTSIQHLLGDTHSTIGLDFMGDLHMQGFQYLPADTLPTHLKIGKRFVDRLPGSISEVIESVYRQLTRPGNRSSGAFGNRITREQRAHWLTDRFLDVSDHIDHPWFGFIHYWDTHMEYSSEPVHREEVVDRTYDDGHVTIEELQEKHPDNPVMERLGGFNDIQTVGDLKRRYDAAVRCVDDHLGRLVRTLEERGELSETMIIVTADHGESLTEHGVLFDHRELYDQTWHVPLIISAPGFDGTEDSFVQHFDLVPTILDFLGKDYEPDAFDGRSLVPGEGGRPRRDAVYAEQTHNARQQAMRTARYKFIRKLNEPRPGRLSDANRPDSQLFDLKTDPGEEQNVAEDHPNLCARLASQLDEWLDALPEPESGDTPISHPSDDEALMEHLDALGYKFD